MLQRIKRMLRTQLPDAVIDGINDLQEVRAMLAENIKSWFEEHEHKGRQEGRQEGEALGRQQGEALALQRLLSKRFGAIPSDITVRIAAASATQIETWFDLAIDARQLSDVFGEN
jgi:flagellar biosynthesis/type III secretory pathway protein FliH